MHGYASDPAILLEDLLHISLHYLEGVQVAHKHPEERHLSTILLLPPPSPPPPAVDGLGVLAARLVPHLAYVHPKACRFLFYYSSSSLSSPRTNPPQLEPLW